MHDILSSWWRGLGAMPAWLGLGRPRFRAMMNRHFPNLPWEESRIIAPELSEHKRLESMEVAELIHRHADRSLPEEETFDVALMIGAGCQGQNHLYQDMGFSTRQQLAAMIAWNFPALKRANHRDMKWKKFIYKQLCLEDGPYVCRSPSCAVCPDYSVCFGPEE
ncbi:MAG: nitrogen fixation protein NifQ [Magnetococcales bacterium]|nr:nitrogen fixation protein NifQ [Magnetococcales bacterium]